MDSKAGDGDGVRGSSSSSDAGRREGVHVLRDPLLDVRPVQGHNDDDESRVYGLSFVSTAMVVMTQCQRFPPIRRRVGRTITGTRTPFRNMPKASRNLYTTPVGFDDNHVSSLYVRIWNATTTILKG